MAICQMTQAPRPSHPFKNFWISNNWFPFCTTKRNNCSQTVFNTLSETFSFPSIPLQYKNVKGLKYLSPLVVVVILNMGSKGRSGQRRSHCLLFEVVESVLVCWKICCKIMRKSKHAQLLIFLLSPFKI